MGKNLMLIIHYILIYNILTWKKWAKIWVELDPENTMSQHTKTNTHTDTHTYRHKHT